MNMRRIYRIVFFVFSFITATFLFACASDEELLAVNDVKDELLVCDLGSFADSVGGTVIGDWRRTGGEGVEVSATEEGLDVTYSFTRESSSNNSDVLCRLDFTKTLSVELDSGDILHVSISECYNATTQSASSLSLLSIVSPRMLSMVKLAVFRRFRWMGRRLVNCWRPMVSRKQLSVLSAVRWTFSSTPTCVLVNRGHKAFRKSQDPQDCDVLVARRAENDTSVVKYSAVSLCPVSREQGW